MHAQILVAEEMEDLAARVTNAVLAVIVGLAEQLTDPGLRSAAGALVVAARDELAHAPVDPEPLVRAILNGVPMTPPPVDQERALALTPAAGPVAAPAYWPAVPEISDELFAEYAAHGPQEPDGDLPDPAVSPQPADQTPAHQTPAHQTPEHQTPTNQTPDSPAAATEPAADPGVNPTTAMDAGPGLNPVHGARHQARPLRRRKRSRRE